MLEKMTTYLITFPEETLAGCSMKVFRIPVSILGKDADLLTTVRGGFYVYSKPNAETNNYTIYRPYYRFWRSGQRTYPSIPQGDMENLHLVHSIVSGEKYQEYSVVGDVKIEPTDEKLIAFHVHYDVDF